MVGAPQQHPHHLYSDEISLVEIAALFIKRRKLFLLTFTGALVLGVALAFLIPQQYRYTSLYKLSETGKGDFLSSPETVISTLQSQYLPELKSQHLAKHGEALQLSVEITNPEGSNLIKLTSEAPEGKASLVKNLHGAMLKKLDQAQTTRLDAHESAIKQQIESVQKVVDNLKGVPDAATAMTGAYDKLFSLQAQLDAQSPGQVLTVSSASDSPVSASRVLTTILAILLACMVAVAAVLISAFAEQVRKELD